MDFVCSWQHNPSWYLETAKYNVYLNTVRVPISHEFIDTGNFQILDAFIRECDRLSFRVVLDWHRNFRGHQAPKPDSDGVPSIEHFVNDWIQLLHRYERNPSMYGVGIFNEIQNEPLEYVLQTHRNVITTIEAEFPNRFRFFAGCTGWGGNCMGMQALMTLPNWNRVFIEVHKYIFSQPNTEHGWDVSMPKEIPCDHWFVGEMGWIESNPDQLQWAHQFIAYLKKRGIRNACFWTVALSSDTQGMWADDCQTFYYSKAALFKSIWEG